MEGRWELGLPVTSASSLKEQVARKILQNVRSQGHPYIELREDGKKLIYFCTLCLSPCYSDTILFDHLKGNLHSQRLSAAKITLLKPNPWPFNDGVLFFDNSTENDKHLKIPSCNQKRLLESHDNDDSLAIVEYVESLNTSRNGHVEADGYQSTNEDMELATVHPSIQVSSPHKEVNNDCAFVIPGLLIGDKVADVKVRGIGLGKISARFFDKDEVLNGIIRIWCEWLGKPGSGQEDDDVEVPEHDFAVVIFSYNCDLGRKGLLDNVKSLLPSTTTAESENGGGSSLKRKKSFSDPEDISESLSNQYDSSGEDSSASNGTTSKLILDQYDNQLLHAGFISNKAIRKELRRQQRVAAEKMCDICQHKMLPGKDVATLLNLKTGRLACSSRNRTGSFHVFHISCLIHWILLREFDTITNHLVPPKATRRVKRKIGARFGGIRDGEMKALRNEKKSVFCPECQGTGLSTEEDELENTCFHLSELFRFKIKMSDARRAWMKNPEVLENCSTGFHFPLQAEEIVQENVKPLKLLHFYQADE
ncbi:Acyl-[acyl-carrier-protein]--UDP-N-acetylglucosamine O-acyltransferase [Quillaja saponaria]|uniref:Acyl-[acyl-carrier-protein]--UDP-N-acetylglucosamine O-acyltransferase n=1 Tax=Quillaja saponaria TaxID=32244 RepID=A0AAD7L003_QUISA|nr:Acyl-[acyl-carrier-protein]--UDP-N-acetylglucosamine O-acyltransferase [Quillaja saponaria]